MAEILAQSQDAKFKNGSLVEGTVTSVKNGEVFIDIGYKSTGSVDASEFGEGAAPSHLGATAESPAPATADDAVSWAAEAEQELRKVPFFVRGKARRNTERYATERGIGTITLETLYDAKAHLSR